MKKLKSVPINEAIAFGWNNLMNQFWFWTTIILFNVIIGYAASYFSEKSELHFTLATVALAILSLIITIGMIKISLRVYDKEAPKITDIFVYTQYIWKYLLASILYIMIVLAGLIVLIIPGIYLAIRYRFVFLLIIDKNMGVWEAFRKSSELSKGVIWPLLFWHVIVAISIIIVVMFTFGLGALLVVPISWMANAYIYRKLSEQIIIAPDSITGEVKL